MTAPESASPPAVPAVPDARREARRTAGARPTTAGPAEEADAPQQGSPPPGRSLAARLAVRLLTDRGPARWP